MITNLSEHHSLLQVWMRALRDVALQNDRARFRRNLERIGEIAAFEISKSLPYEEITVQTPMGECTCYALSQQPVVATILRAGLPLHQGVMNFFDEADAAFIAAYRRHKRDGSFEIAQQYLTAPNLNDRDLILADPMLATGASLALSLDVLKATGKPSSIHVVSAIACTEGIDLIMRRHPEVHIWAGAIDEELTARGYIVPGLGDAGDLSFGPKTQA
ncbi:MAG: uracil phosphoribosyltransferase [Bacteroidetes bacterium]|nr:uracil phosphoribosyltransferase [Bacteroidota bacterium]MBS1630372.1 uracil phosphoribosyltransferase [Bacteroidota bacterium]